MSSLQRIVIVGASLAGLRAAETLRADGFDGSITIVGDEPHLPYDRPPLSKAVMQGEVGIPQLALIADDKFAELQAEFRAGERVVAIDRAARRVSTASGEQVGYDALFLANGGRARWLPGLAAHPRVLALRTYEDALAIKAQLARARQVLVLGGGWIGLEVAASARKLGAEVTVLEAAPRLCIRTVPPCVSEHLHELHTSHGVALRLGAAVQQVQADDDGVSVTLADGRCEQGDLLVVGIGLVANDELAAAVEIVLDYYDKAYVHAAVQRRCLAPFLYSGGSAAEGDGDAD